MANKTKEERKQARIERRANRKQRRAENKLDRQKRREQRKKDKTRLIDQVAEKIHEIIDKEIDKIREERLEKATKEKPGPEALKEMVAKYVLESVTNSVKSGLLPGFVGMVTVIPEIITTFRNQLRLIYDIGIANGYDDVIDNELILFIVIDAVGRKTIGIGIIKDNKITIKKADESVLIALVKLVAGYFVQQLAKSIVAKWLPGLGGAVMALWSRQSTKQIAENANNVFEKEITKSPEQIANDIFEKAALEQEKSINGDEAEDEDIDVIKFQVLINLMKKDGEIHPDEKRLFSKMVDNADLDQDDKEDLLDQIEEPDEFEPDYSFFHQNEDHAAALLIDMIALAKSDKSIDKSESQYLFDVAKKIGLSQSKVISLLNIV